MRGVRAADAAAWGDENWAGAIFLYDLQEHERRESG